MTQEDLFSQQDNLPPKLEDDKDYFVELVGENKKFKDEKALARGKAEADMFVNHLKSELDTMRADYLRLREEHMAGQKLQEMIDQLKNQQQSGNENLPADDVKQPEIKLEDIKKSVLEDIKKEQSLEKERANLTIVQEKLKERYGHNVPNILKQQRETLGMTEDQVNDLARKSPQAFFRLMNLEEQPQRQDFQAPPSSTQRQGFAPSTQKRTWSWWQELKKSKPNEYWDPKNISQRHKDAVDLGDAFNDGDAERWERLGNPQSRYN